MTTTELKTKIAEATNPKWFDTAQATFDFSYIGQKLSFTGVSAIYEYIHQQLSGWNEFNDLPKELSQCKVYFENAKKAIIQFMARYLQSNLNNLDSHWQNQVRDIIRNVTQKPLPYNIPQVEFLLKIYNDIPKYYQGAYNFIIGTNYNVNSQDLFYGAILAYEFTLKDHTEITERRNAEKSSMLKLQTDFQKYLSASETQLSEHLHNMNTKYVEYTQKIDNLKSEKEKLFFDWFENTKTEQWQKWFDPASKKIAELENTYKEKLKLEEPAKYWSERAQKLKKQAWWALGVFIILVIIVCSFLSFVLVKTPKDLLENLFNGNIGGAIKWAIVFATLISFFAYAIRAVSKVMFSSFHLARDCEERHTLTYFYLSLLKDSKVADSERQLIIQSLEVM